MIDDSDTIEYYNKIIIINRIRIQFINNSYKFRASFQFILECHTNKTILLVYLYGMGQANRRTSLQTQHLHNLSLNDAKMLINFID